MQTIYLTDRNRPLTISDSAYEQIVALVNANRAEIVSDKPKRGRRT